MENKHHNKDDELRAENAVLRLKLEQEFGMLDSSGSMEDPKMENDWLRHIYNIEKQAKERKTIAVYDFLGRPDFKRPEDLHSDELERELDRLMTLCYEKRVLIDNLYDCPPEELYRFIVEDLFPYQTDDFAYPGTATWFIYEDFYPNHERDIADYCCDTLSYILFGEWDDYWFKTIMSEKVLLNGKTHDKLELKSILKVYAEAHEHIEIEEFEDERIQFDLQMETGSYSAQLYCYNEQTKMECRSSIRFGLKFEISMWVINAIQLPSFSTG